MAEETTPPSEPEGTTPPTDGKPAETPDAKLPEPPNPARTSVEEVEAYWKNRQSQEASAHSVREQVLREQVATLEGTAKATRVDEARDTAANQTEVQRLTAENTALREQNSADKAAALTETRKAKYPFAAENIDASTLGQMDEANLAGLNEKLKPSSTGGISPTAIMDANAAGRPTPSASKPLSEKTREELMSDLKAQGPAFVESFRGK